MSTRKASSTRKTADRTHKSKAKASTSALPAKTANGKAKRVSATPAPAAKRTRKAAEVSRVDANVKSESRALKGAKATSAEEGWTLRLYVTGRGERSESALRNLRRLCEQSLTEGTYQIEVIDLMKHPELAKADEIIAIPTLVRKLPEPMKRIIGDLSNADRALLSLDFPTLGAAKAKRSPEANP